MNIRGVALAATVVLSCVWVASPAQAQTAIFLEIPGVVGESTTPGFVDQIEVLSASFGGSKPACNGTLNVSDLALLKNTDKASVDLWAALRDHTVFPTITLRFVISSTSTVYQSYQLSNAVVTSVQIAGSTEPRTTESVTFYFSQATITYTYVDGGGKTGSPESTTLVVPSCP